MVGFKDPEGLFCFCYCGAVPEDLEVAWSVFAEGWAGEGAWVEFGCGHFGRLEEGVFDEGAEGHGSFDDVKFSRDGYSYSFDVD